MSTSIVRRRFLVDDVLTDVTSMKLSDPTESFGIRRNDNDGEIAADGTDMTRVSTGVYEYEWTDPAYDLTYTVWIELVYDGETTWEESTKNGGTTAGDLGMTWSDICGEVEVYTGNSTAGNALTHVIPGYRRLLRGVDLTVVPPQTHAWSFLRPQTTITVGGAQTGTATGDSEGEVEATADIFDISMVGLTMTITDVGDVTIEDYESPSIVQTSGDEAFASKAVSVEGTGIYDLESDFAGILTPFIYVGSQTDDTPAMVEVSPEQIFRIWRDEDSADDPVCWAIVPATLVETTGQRSKLIVAPVPDASRVLAYRYRANAAVPQDDSLYPHGGPDMADAILACGLADAEVKIGKLVNGPLEMAARDRLVEAIVMDRRFNRVGTARGTTARDLGTVMVR